MKLVIYSLHPSFPPPPPFSLSVSVNVDEVDELIKSITAGPETEKDRKIQRMCSENESWRAADRQTESYS